MRFLRTVLPLSPIKPDMGAYTVPFKENLHHVSGQPHIDLTLDILVRNGVKLPTIYANMVIVLDSGNFPCRMFILVERKRKQKHTFFGKQRSPASVFFLKLPVI